MKYRECELVRYSPTTAAFGLPSLLTYERERESQFLWESPQGDYYRINRVHLRIFCRDMYGWMASVRRNWCDTHTRHALSLDTYVEPAENWEESQKECLSSHYYLDKGSLFVRWQTEVSDWYVSLKDYCDIREATDDVPSSRKFLIESAGMVPSSCEKILVRAT